MKELLEEITRHRLVLKLDQGRLRIYSRGPVANQDLIARIKAAEHYLILLLGQQAGVLQHGQRDRLLTIANAPSFAEEGYLLSPAQYRLYVVCQDPAANVAYNMPATFRISGELELTVLQTAFSRLIARHEILRTIFKENDQGEIRQYVLPAGETGFHIRLERKQNEPHSADRLLREEMLMPFDLSVGPLIRVTLIGLGQNECLLSYTMHHIISDGWSLDIVLRELLEFYQNAHNDQPDKLPPLPFQYRHYAAWQQEQTRSAAMAVHRSYWLQQLSGPLPLLDLQWAGPRPSLKTYHGGAVDGLIDEADLARFRTICTANNCTLFMGLLAAITILLYKNSGQKDIIAGTPLAGRQHPGLEDQVGLYLNTLALRLRFCGDEKLTALLAEARKIMLDAQEHQDLPLEELADSLDLRPDRGRNLLFDVWIVLNDWAFTTEVLTSAAEGLDVKRYTIAEEQRSRFDLLFGFTTSPAGLRIRVEYNSDLLKASHAALFIEEVMQVIVLAGTDPLIRVEDIRTALEDSYREKEEQRLFQSSSLRLKNFQRQ